MGFSFNKKYFSDDEIIEYVNSPDMHVTILSFTDENGYILTCPVWSIFYNGKFYFSTDDFSKKYTSIMRENSKISLSIIEKDSFPNGRPGIIPYFSVTGRASVRRKEEFDEYKKVLDLLYDKFSGGFQKPEHIEDWKNKVLNEMESRVLIEIEPEKTIVYHRIEKYVQEQAAAKAND